MRLFLDQIIEDQQPASSTSEPSQTSQDQEHLKFLAYQLDSLEQEELYTIQIQDNRGAGNIIQVSDAFWLSK